MKRNDSKRIEAIAQELLNAPTEETKERMEVVKQRAFQEYVSRAKADAESLQETSPRRGSILKGLGHRLMTAVAMALAIIVLPVVVTMISPVPVSTADDEWGRSIIIWLNDTFHTEIKVPESVREKGGLSDMTPGEEKVFYSIEDAAAFLNEDLLVIGSEAVPCELQSITISSIEEGIYRITEEYILGTTEISIILRTALSSQTVAPLAETITVSSSAGDLLAWDYEGASRAFCLYKDWLVIIYMECNLDDAISVFSTVHVVN